MWVEVEIKKKEFFVEKMQNSEIEKQIIDNSEEKKIVTLETKAKETDQTVLSKEEVKWIE